MLFSNKLNKKQKIFIFFEQIRCFKYDLNLALAASTLSERVYIILSRKYYQKLNAHKLYGKQLKGLKALGITIISTPSPRPSPVLKIRNPNLINYNELVDLLASTTDLDENHASNNGRVIVRR